MIPTTDEEAINILSTELGQEPTSILIQSMISIYQIRRLVGQSVVHAYEEALLAGGGYPPKVTIEQLSILAAEDLLK